MKIAFLGDIAFMDNYRLSGAWVESIASVVPVLSKCDYVVANLETPLTERSRTFTCKGIHIKSDYRVCNVLKALGVNAVSLSNNHCFDFGKKGLDDTKECLIANNIQYFGTCDSNCLVINDEIALHGFCCYSTNGAGVGDARDGIPALTRSNVQKELKVDRSRNHFSVLSFHWGNEYSHYPDKRQRELALALAEGDNLIIQGNHTHSIQGIERAGNSLVMYSQGNFFFDRCVSPINGRLVIEQSRETKKTFVAIVVIEAGRIQSYEIHGFINEEGILKPYAIHDEMEEYSSGLSRVGEREFDADAIRYAQNLRSKNHAKHDVSWLISKANYYSIGAKLLSYVNEFKYKKAY